MRKDIEWIDQCYACIRTKKNEEKDAEDGTVSATL